MWRISRSLRRRRASPDVVEQGERCERICLRRMRHPRCQSANSNCGGLNLRLPRCMLWPSETLSPLSSLPVSASGRCLSESPCVCVPCRASTVYAVGGASRRSMQHGPQVGSPVRFLRRSSGRFRVSTVRSSRVPVVRRFGYWGTFGRVRDRLRVPPRDSRDGVVSVESISRAECRRRQSERPLSGSGRRHGRWVRDCVFHIAF